MCLRSTARAASRSTSNSLARTRDGVHRNETLLRTQPGAHRGDRCRADRGRSRRRTAVRHLPFFDSGTAHSAYFAEAGGLQTGAAVQVAGLRVGEVEVVDLDGRESWSHFEVDDGVDLGDRAEAAIKTKSLLGAKILRSPRAVRQSGRAHTVGPHHVGVPTARCPRRSGGHHQRVEHRPGVRLADDHWPDTFRTRHPICRPRWQGWPGSPRPSMSAMRNCADSWRTPTRRPACWPNAPTRWSV